MPAGDLQPAELVIAFFGWSWILTATMALVELASGVLLLRRETALAGALLLLGVLSNAALINVLFDVPGKSLSPHFMLITGLLVLPDARRLFDAHLLGRPVGPADLGHDVSGPRWLAENRRAIKIALVALMVASPVVLILRTRGYLFSATHHPAAGLYEATQFVRGGVEHPPIHGDELRWRFAVVGPTGETMHVRNGDGRWNAYRFEIDTSTKRMMLSAAKPSDGRALEASRFTPLPFVDTLRYTRDAAGTLRITGDIGGVRTEVTLAQVPPTRFQFIRGNDRR